MNILDKLEKNEKGIAIMNRTNVAYLMVYIMENRISNVNHFIIKEIKANISGYNTVLRKFKTELPEFYNNYKLVVENSKNETIERIKDVLVYMGLLMNNGIELEDGTFREFDLFDWFILKNKYFDNLNRQEITKIIDEFSFDTVIYFENLNSFEIRKFISGAYGDSLQNYSMPVYELYEYDNVKNLISKEEYDKLFAFMKLHNMPLNKRNFDVGVDKMIKQRNTSNNLFEINNNIEHNKTLTKKRR